MDDISRHLTGVSSSLFSGPRVVTAAGPDTGVSEEHGRWCADTPRPRAVTPPTPRRWALLLRLERPKTSPARPGMQAPRARVALGSQLGRNSQKWLHGTRFVLASNHTRDWHRASQDSSTRSPRNRTLATLHTTSDCLNAFCCGSAILILLNVCLFNFNAPIRIRVPE